MKRWNVALVVVIVVVAFSAPAWSQGQDMVFYDGFESGNTTGWWAPARVGETGLRTCYDEVGTVIACAGTGQDGDIQPGVAWPNPRFVDNGDGTVTDMLTGLTWLKNASCSELAGTDPDALAPWVTALTAAAALADGTCGLSDGSEAGWWRLPSVKELVSLIDYEYYGPGLSDAAGTGQWSEGDAFSGVSSSSYWSSTSIPVIPDHAWVVFFGYAGVFERAKTVSYYVWPVRDGQ